MHGKLWKAVWSTIEDVLKAIPVIWKVVLIWLGILLVCVMQLHTTLYYFIKHNIAYRTFFYRHTMAKTPQSRQTAF